MPKAPKICPLCGNRFHPTNKGGTQRYCSKSCAGSGRTRPHPQYDANGGAWVDANGYRIVVIDGKPILEHRHLMEQHLGRSLLSTEICHHRNFDPADNRIKNLEILTRAEHLAAHRTKHYGKKPKFYRSDTHKQCSQCKAIKPREDFYPRKPQPRDKEPHRSECKQCSKAAARRK